MHTEFAEYPDNIKDIIICGDGEGYKGLIASLDARYQRKMQGHIEMYPLEYYMTESVCTHCGGRRLNENALSFTVGGKNIAEFTEMSVDAALEFVNNLKLSQEKTIIAEAIVKELKGRLGFLKNVGLGYLTLSRSSGTLSGGESQRIRLATKIQAEITTVPETVAETVPVTEETTKKPEDAVIYEPGDMRRGGSILYGLLSSGAVSKRKKQ